MSTGLMSVCRRLGCMCILETVVDIDVLACAVSAVGQNPIRCASN